MKAILSLVVIALCAFYVNQNHPEVIDKLVAAFKPTPPPVVAPPPPPPVVEAPPEPTVKRWYLTERASITSDHGVSAIAAGTEVQLINTLDGQSIVTDGRVTLKVLETSLTNEPPKQVVTVVSNSMPSRTQDAPSKAASIAPPEDHTVHNARIQAQMGIIDDQINQLNRRIGDLESQQSLAKLYGKSSAHGVSIARIQQDITRLNNHKMTLVRAIK